MPEEALDPDVSAIILAAYFVTHGAPRTSVVKQADAGNWPETRRLVAGGMAGLARYLEVIGALERAGAGRPRPRPRPTRVFPVVGYRGAVNLHWGQVIGIGGSDLMFARGADVVAIERSRVEEAGWSAIGGWNVSLKGLESGLDYYYAHGDPDDPNARGVFVRGGQEIDAGHRIMVVGDSGNARGAGTHLHLGIGHGINTGGRARRAGERLPRRGLSAEDPRRGGLGRG